MRIRMRSLGAVGVASAALAIAAAPAQGAVLDPAAVDFGNQAVGTTSAPKPLTLTAGCVVEIIPGVCSVPEVYVASLGTSGDFADTSDCPSLLTGGDPSVSCTINVTFTPTGTGFRSGTLDAGGLVATLTGTGVSPSSSAGTTSAQNKKCKKRKHHKYGRRCRRKK